MRRGRSILVQAGVLLATLMSVGICVGTAQKTGQNEAPPSQRGVTRNPHGPMKAACQTCHTNTSWKPIRSFPEFDHNKTSYPLRGMHRKVDCASCHSKLVFSDVGTKCADCHADLHRGQFGARCEQCHTVKGWNVTLQAVKEHANRFPLFGAHASVDCAACHQNAAVGQFTSLRTDCFSCHAQDYQNTKSSGLDHVALNFPTTCEQCHNADSWFGANFDHTKVTGFALTGAHVRLACTSCHVGGRFKGTPADCNSCHNKDFRTTTDPNHVSARFPTTCQMCHTTATWQGATFNHNSTPFPLTGAHVTVPCSSCHVGNKFAGTPTDCYSCHQKDFQGTNNPSHTAAGFPTTCQTCHTTSTWQGAKFDHAQTGFSLTGAHVTTPCSRCHVNGKFAGTPTDCYSCHVKDYQGTTNPNHAAAGFPKDCSVCHSTASWANAVFNHNNTPFPLTGAHVTVACASCHVGNKFAGTPTDCYSCHQKNYQGTTNPNHVAAGFPTTCSVCHNTTSWANATFNHNNTPFPLTGAHVNVPCTSCHVGSKFAGTPTDCYSCHKTAYQGTTSPNHVAAGFPTTCQTCHTTTSWLGATFNHTWFRIPHHNAQCSDCHSNSSNYAVFVCTNCHTQAATAPKHQGVQGYVWNSANCYACHKN